MNDLTTDNETLAALDRVVNAKTDAEKAATKQAAIDHKYKLMREQGYDQAWPERRQTSNWLSKTLFAGASSMLCWLLIATFVYAMFNIFTG